MTRTAQIAAIVVLAFGALPAVAHAAFGIAPGSLTASTVDSAGNPVNLAGGHPDRLLMSFAFKPPGGAIEGNVKDVEVELPEGMVGNPRAVLACTRALFAVGTCPAGSQLGTLLVDLGSFTQSQPIYNLEPGADNLAMFGLGLASAGRIYGQMRQDGGALVIRTFNAVQDFAVGGVSVEFWGVPADHLPGAGLTRQPFLTNPRNCDGPPPTATVRATSWQHPDEWVEASTETGAVPVGCESQLFAPALTLGLDTTDADTPTGVRATLALPQNDDPDGQSAVPLRDVSLLLPGSLTLSAGAAGGLSACPDDAAHLGTSLAPECPSASRIGTIKIASALLTNPILGALYLGRKIGETDYRLFAIAHGAGFDFTRAGTLHADPATGQLTAVLSGLPAVPLDQIELSFKSGPRAPLVTSLSCGASTAVATFTPYGGGSPVVSSAPIAIATGPSGVACPAALPFAPSFVAGVSPARAGAAGPFSMVLRRRDGEQLFDRFRMALPPGLSAKVAAARRCADAGVAAGSCPADSRVGSFVAEVGAGSAPHSIEGGVFLTGPYRRAPFGFALVLPRAVGPFDLGTTVIRAALRVDPNDGSVTIESDALPRIVGGVPLRLRTLALDIDRPGFMVNPTSCRQTRIEATVDAVDESVSRSTVPFAVGGCRRLRFAPALSAELTGRDQLRRKGGHPGLRLKLGMRPGGANALAADIVLPKLLGLGTGGVTAVCSREQAKDGRCPQGSRVGAAGGRSPLLSGPLSGDVYLVQPRGKGLPDLWARVGGDGVALNLRIETVSKRGRLHAKLIDLPDFPLSSFTLRLAGGKDGVLATTAAPCAGGRARRLVTTAEVSGQNGAYRRLRSRVRSAARCG